VANYTYPTATELAEIEQVKLPRLVADSPIFRLFPFEGKRSHLLEWEQEDNYGGLAQIRGLNGKPPRVVPVGAKSFLMKPGVYGEFMAIDEMERTLRRAYGAFNTPASLDDLVMRRQDQLLLRRLNRIEWLCWQLAIYGYFRVMDNKNAVVHTSGYANQQYTAAVAWDAADTATPKPLYDFRAIQLLGRGQSADFGPGATAYVNRVTANHLMANTNPADLGKKLTVGLNPVTSVQSMNTILSLEGLPNVEVYDDGYHDEDGTWYQWIPDGKVLVVGRRQSGAPLGNFRFTFNVNNPGGEPAPYTRVIDRTEDTIPAEVEVHDGFNGGPVIYHPGSLVVMNV
jgi:hypothetical protein